MDLRDRIRQIADRNHICKTIPDDRNSVTLGKLSPLQDTVKELTAYS